MSADVGTVAETLIREERLQRVALVGFSMGGNLVLKMLGEWGTQAPPQITAGIGVSPAMDLAASADALHNRQNRIYEWKFMRGLKKRIQRKAALYPERYDTRYLHGLRSLREFDDQVTARYCGFRDAQDYYTRAASTQVLDRIAVPTLVLHAADDPFIRVLPATLEKLLHNPSITYIETERAADIVPSLPKPTDTTAAGLSARPSPLCRGLNAANLSLLPNGRNSSGRGLVSGTRR